MKMTKSTAGAPRSESRGASQGVVRPTQLKRSLQGKGYDEQAGMLKPDEVPARAATGVAGTGVGMPHGQAIQEAFGAHDVSSVQAHVGGAAEAACTDIGAEAYASGASVAFRKAPDVHTAAHEAAHVVQQRAGVDLPGGVGAAGDAHEQHADAVADRVVAGESAETLLDEVVPQSHRRAGAVQTKSAPGSVVQREGGLNDKQRAELLRITGDRISMAYTDFVSALQAHKDAIKAAAKAAADMLAMFVDIGMGFLTPSLVRGLSALVNKIPVNAPEFMYAAALKLQNADFAKAVFAGATKVGNQLVKDNAMALFGETEDDAFLETLQGHFRVGFTAINENLPNLSDDEVTAVCAAFDPSATNKGAYKEKIAELLKKFKEDVKSIGDVSPRQGELGHPERETWANQQAVMVSHEYRWKCALLYFHGMEDNLRGERLEDWHFVKWISPEMQAISLARTKEQHGDVRYLGPGDAQRIDQLPPEDPEMMTEDRARPH